MAWPIGLLTTELQGGDFESDLDHRKKRNIYIKERIKGPKKNHRISRFDHVLLRSLDKHEYLRK